MYREARCPKFQTLSASHFTASIWNISLPSRIKLKDNTNGFCGVVCVCTILAHTWTCVVINEEKIQKGLKPFQQKNLIPSSSWVNMQYHLNLGGVSVCAHIYLYEQSEINSGYLPQPLSSLILETDPLTKTEVQGFGYTSCWQALGSCRFFLPSIGVLGVFNHIWALEIWTQVLTLA